MENISETYKNFFFESSYINYKLINGQQLNENEKRKYNIIKHLITAYYKCVNIHDNKNCVNTLFKDAASSESNITHDEEGEKLVLNTTNKIIDEQNKIINNKTKSLNENQGKKFIKQSANNIWEGSSIFQL